MNVSSTLKLEIGNGDCEQVAGRSKAHWMSV
jgi:hypothetical protein